MTTVDQDHTAEQHQFATAGTLLDGLAAQDFDLVASALATDVHLRALLPPGFREWSGREEVSQQFARWFGNTVAYEVVDATVGEIGGRMQLRWRLRVCADRLGPGWFTVEQQTYADLDRSSRIARLDLMCSGFRPAADRA